MNSPQKRYTSKIHTPGASSIRSISRKIDVTQHDIHTISDNDNLSPAVINAYFTLIKQVNRKDVLLGKSADKVMGFSSRMAQRIVIDKIRSSIKINIFRYDIIFFPLNYKYFWALLVINFREKTAAIYNPTKNEVPTQEILIQVFTFLSNEYQKQY